MGAYKLLITKKITRDPLAPGLPPKIRSNTNLGEQSPDGIQTDAFSGEKGFIDITEEEFIQIRPVQNAGKTNEVLHWVDHPEEIAIVFTSKNAVRCTAVLFNIGGNNKKKIPDWKVFCLEGITKETVIEYLGAGHIIGTAKNAAELATHIVENRNYRKIVFFCGDKRRDELPAILNQNGIEIVEIPVYQTIQTPVKISVDPDGIVFFSPSAVESFFSINTLNESAVCFAIGSTTASALQKFTDNRIIKSQSPDEHQMMQTVWNHIKKSIATNDHPEK